jgi:uncharacterized protein
MKRFLGVLFCLAFLLVGANAQQSSDLATKEQSDDLATKEEAQRLFDVMHSRQNSKELAGRMSKQLLTMSSSILEKQFPNATAERKEQMRAFANSTTQKMLANAPFDEMIQAQLPVYQRHFTHAEIQQMIEFYLSPVGQKFIIEMPVIASEGMQASFPILQKWMETAMVEMRKSCEEYARNLKQKDSNAEPPAQKPAESSGKGN